MKKNILLFTVNFLLFCLCNATSKAWGPIFKIEIHNDNNQKVDLYLGVDSLATDGYDEEVEFKFEDTLIKENYDLPPAPPSGIYCFFVRDTNDAYNTKSYVDIRSIDENQDKFFHQYKLEIPNWAAFNPAEPNLKISWGTLPDGIDSAKISWDGSYIVNTDMRENEELIINNSFWRHFNILVWYNKKHSDIIDTQCSASLTIENNRLNVNCNEIHTINIYSILGDKIISSKENNVDISGLTVGIYIVVLVDVSGKKSYHKFLK